MFRTIGFFFIFFSGSLLFSLDLEVPSSPLSSKPSSTVAEDLLKRKGDLYIHNQVLARVHGKIITVLDVVRLLDYAFERDYPQYIDQPEARLEFYSYNWKYILQDLVDRELILADAKGVNMPVSTGDVRKEMEYLYGPNVLETLENRGMNYNETWEQVRLDITFRRMLGARVNSLAAMEIGPKRLKEAYQGYLEENAGAATWFYRVISIRHPSEESSLELAKAAKKLLDSGEVDVEALASHFQNQEGVSEDLRIAVSDLFEKNKDDLSPLHGELLCDLEPGMYSEPKVQTSRGKEKVVRIAYLDRAQGPDLKSFEEMESTLSDQLFQQFMAKESKSYLKGLRKKFDVEEVSQLDHLTQNPFSYN